MKRKESLVYGTYFGGTISDSFYSVAIDCNNYVYITGVTKSNDFPTTDSGYEKNNYNDLSNTFLVKFDVNKGGEEGILYSSYLSGNGNDIGYSVAVDYNECAYITGVTTSSEEFPITEKSFQTEILNSRENGFLSKIRYKNAWKKKFNIWNLLKWKWY
ncbi:SBBP repeat-containing protein [Clostridium sp.]|uniref:SBBP repeat-containing protein n=1 Tax=Clostridium sp. TaxID=1506 RepID=UPI003521675D